MQSGNNLLKLCKAKDDGSKLAVCTSLGELAFLKASRKSGKLRKVHSLRLNITHIMHFSKNIMVAMEEDDRSFRIGKEFIYHFYIIDTKRYAVIQKKISLFRGQRLYGMFKGRFYTGSGKFNTVVFVFRRNSGIFLLILNMDNMNHFSYLLN